MANFKKKIATRLAALKDIADVSVERSSSDGEITISHKRHHVADFYFKWVDDNHYVGYFMDAKGKKSQAIVSLWTPMEAIKFMVLFATLVELGAKRPGPLD